MQTFLVRDEQVKVNCLAAVRALPSWKVTEVIIQEPKKTRPQEKYWHLLLGILAKHTGDTLEDVKDRIKLAVLPPRILEAKGKTYVLPAHSSTLKKEEYTRLIDATLMIFDQLGMVAPAPGYYGIELKERGAA